jgi:hypothetical protein
MAENNQVSKLLLLNLGMGNLQEGLPAITAQVWTARNNMPSQFRGSLPPAPQLAELYQDWKLLYEALHQRLDWPVRLIIIDSVVVSQVSDQDFEFICKQLRSLLNKWLSSESFLGIDRALQNSFQIGDEIQVIFETEDPVLRRLPWHLWKSVETYPKAEIALSAPEWHGANPSKSPPGIVRILSVFGNSKGLDLKIERELLTALPEADVVFLDEPDLQTLEHTLRDEEGWDILFFAGHSQSEGETGWIHLNANESLSINQFDHALAIAIDNGLQLAIFNSCDGLGLAQQFEKLNLPQAIVMREPVLDIVAQNFLRYFLQEFAQGESFYLAVKKAKQKLQEIEGDYPCASWLPVICQNPTAIFPTWETLRDQGLRRIQPGISIQIPQLPDKYVSRPEHSQPLKLLLIQTVNSGSDTLVVSAIYGLGGIGKSVLATALVHDYQVQRYFSDGILWVTLGQQPDIQRLLGDWIRTLGDFNYKPTTVQEASQHLRTLLTDKQILLVVDDVWQPEHLELFRVGGQHCLVLVTTREALIQDAERYELDVMTEDQSLALLTRRMNRPLEEQELSKAIVLVKSVGYLPLAIELAAVQINDNFTIQELLGELELEVADLTLLDSPIAIQTSVDEKNRKYSLRACFNLSLRRLSFELLHQFAWLGVLPDDVVITPQMAGTLWGVRTAKAKKILQIFKHRALLTSCPTLFDQTPTYRLHDLMHDMARWLTTQSPEAELSGLGLTYAEAQKSLLEKYRQLTSDNLWHTLPSDGYIHFHLVWHMEQAGWRDEIHQLLQEVTPEGRNGWYEACDRLGQLAVFVTDVGRAWRLAEELYLEDISQSIDLQIRYALIISSLNSIIDGIPVNLIGALVKTNQWSPAQGLAYARQAQCPSKCSEFIKELIPYLPPYLLPEALEIARRIQGESARVSALCILIPRLPHILSEALGIAHKIQDMSSRVYALSELVLFLPEIRHEALETAHDIKDDNCRFRALLSLIPNFPEVAPEAFDTFISRMQQNNLHGTLSDIVELAPYLPEHLLSEALDSIRDLKVEDQRIKRFSLLELAPYLPEGLMSEALKMTGEIDGDEELQASIISKLAPNLSDNLWPKTLQAGENLWSIIGNRARLFVRVIPHIPDQLRGKDRSFETDLNRALEMICMMDMHDGGYERAMALCELLPYLPTLYLPNIELEVMEAIKYLKHYPNNLHGKLVPYLTNKNLPKAVKILQTIGDEAAQEYAHIRLAPLNTELFFAGVLSNLSISAQNLFPVCIGCLNTILHTILYTIKYFFLHKIKRSHLLFFFHKLHDKYMWYRFFWDPINEVLQVKKCIFFQHLESLLTKLTFIKIKFFQVLVPNDWIIDNWLINNDELEDFKDFESNYRLAEKICRLAPDLSQEQLIEVIKISLENKWNFYRRKILHNIWPFLLEKQYTEIIKISQEIDEHAQIDFMINVLCYIKSREISSLLWNSVLHKLSLRTRESLLRDIGKELGPVVIALSNRSTLKLVDRSIREVCQQWP